MMPLKHAVPIITLDGPSGTGKGTLCHLLAQTLGWHFLDSGAIYRVLAFAARSAAVPLDSVLQLVSLAASLPLRFAVSSEASDVVQSDYSIVYLDGKDITQAIRTEQCGQDASKIAAISDVRLALLERQRAFAVLPGLVTDGRDMGTVVFSEAFLKIYLHASVEARAMRRYLQLQKTQNNVSLAQVTHELVQRDARDSDRTHSPLMPAEDAVSIDTTGLSVEAVFAQIHTLVRQRLLSLVM